MLKLLGVGLVKIRVWVPNRRKQGWEEGWFGEVANWAGVLKVEHFMDKFSC